MTHRTAWTAVTTPNGSTLGQATENQRGYAPLMDSTGLLFESHTNAQDIADRMNEALGLTLEEAHEIVTSSMTAPDTEQEFMGDGGWR